MPYPIPVRRLLNLANPVECPPWECGILLAKKDVLDAVTAGDLLAKPVPIYDEGNPYIHARRIAWLVKHGWSDAIEVDIGIPSMGCYPEWPVLDGNHRLYAAVIRGDREILTSVAGDLGYAAKRFGIKAKLLEDCVARPTN